MDVRLTSSFRYFVRSGGTCPAASLSSRRTNSSDARLRDLRFIEAIRPPSLRGFDQIPMRGLDLLRQVDLFAPMFAGAHVAFVGDSDGISLLLALGAIRGGPRPASLHVLDFDERLLDAAHHLAQARGFRDMLHLWRYNTFDPVPDDLAGRCNFFVTNPPYGMRNRGESARLFIARGAELVTPASGVGAIILPDDVNRPWTRQAMRTTERDLANQGWEVFFRRRAFHRYHLDDDPELASDLLLVQRNALDVAPSRYARRRVHHSEIPRFYGRGTPIPYPRYILSNGALSFDWNTHEDHRYDK